MSEHSLLVSVDNHRCHRYGICQAEAPDNFEITGDGRLAYARRPSSGHREDVLMAARSCPMQAIHVEKR
jgi:sulfoxide reductase heme-binding subunit YedZ